jgi:hypothetical protein
MNGYKGWRNFREFYNGEVRRIPIPRTWVNKGIKKDRGSKQLQTEVLVRLTESLDDP